MLAHMLQRRVLVVHAVVLHSAELFTRATLDTLKATGDWCYIRVAGDQHWPLHRLGLVFLYGIPDNSDAQEWGHYLVCSAQPQFSDQTDV